MQPFNESTIESLLLEHLENAGYIFVKAFGTKHRLCANQFAPPILGILHFLFLTLLEVRL
ncbi:hypothetical protein [Helicobacter apodemus]|uniref:Uncharacterized protein n=1 Tax=Helicobacter apodemus TaxID=135569 RepID=A0A2U8FDK1_9HELI|nr:hypothetical protein [Helicobacter apodemus]AWI34098.1 hypothetical protein CDV25_04410 [Helicobacter apodemus]